MVYGIIALHYCNNPDMGPSIIPILQVRRLAACHGHCFRQDWWFPEAGYPSPAQPSADTVGPGQGKGLWNGTPGQECSPVNNRNLMSLTRCTGCECFSDSQISLSWLWLPPLPPPVLESAGSSPTWNSWKQGYLKDK